LKPIKEDELQEAFFKAFPSKKVDNWL
jgi:hypothetical protein